jgi:transposase
MKRFVEGTDRGQSTLFPECLQDWIGEDNPVRVIDVFVDELDLAELGFGGVDPEATGRPSYHPSVLLKLYIYGYLNRVQSSRRLEREAGRNVEVMWLTGRLVPDHKTIADFRKDNGSSIRKVCARFIALCRAMGLLTQASVAIDGSKFKDPKLGTPLIQSNRKIGIDLPMKILAWEAEDGQVWLSYVKPETLKSEYGISGHDGAFQGMAQALEKLTDEVLKAN